MREQLEALQKEAQAEISACGSLAALNDLKVKYLGKKGPITAALRGLSALPAEGRPRLGQAVNSVRTLIESLLEQKEAEISREELQNRLKREEADITLPGRRPARGRLHPVTLVMDKVKSIFMRMGFEVREGPEIENDYYNFELLNLPKDHPARDAQDTFYITGEYLLRTHTSPVQARVMRGNEPGAPIRMIAPGKVYRCDYDATHSPMFHQVEGLLVDRDVGLSDLKGTLELFIREMFGPKVKVRLRPSYFPFTEPSAEVDISCVICGGRGCRVCKNSGWLEILGSGVVHPRVLEMSGYDSEKMSGFAFGMGVERIAMLVYGIDDLRLFFENDLRFIRQFEREAAL
ncbi:MAG: phenylalanine--tRNA ligase subunit alpha [Acidaminococcales bacterium]|nr:phenylalanine--tRNA ligase subunit alpha [Acidaminococcales bacterium]